MPSWLLWLRWVYISTCLAKKRRARRILRDRAIGDLNAAVLEKSQAMEIALLAWEYPAIFTHRAYYFLADTTHFTYFILSVSQAKPG